MCRNDPVTDLSARMRQDQLNVDYRLRQMTSVADSARRQVQSGINQV